MKIGLIIVYHHQGTSSEFEPVRRLRLPFITELHRSRNKSIHRGRSNSRSKRISTTVPAPEPQPNRKSTASTDTAAQGIDEYGADVLKVGLLTKTSKGRSENSIRQGLTRQRRFRLTEEALEYFHYFSQVSISSVLTLCIDINLCSTIR